MRTAASSQIAKHIAGATPVASAKSQNAVSATRGVISGASVTVGSTTTTTVQLNGSSTDVPADVVGSYAPKAGDVVEVLIIGSRLVVLGPVQLPGMPSIAGLTGLTSIDGSVAIVAAAGVDDLSVRPGEIIFDYQGSLASGVSPPWHSRFPVIVTGFAADLGTFASDLEFAVRVNGSNIGVATMTSASTGHLATTATPLAAYTDLVSVAIVGAGSGNADLIVHVELAFPT